MHKFDLLNDQTAPIYPGHVIIVSGDKVRITGELAVHGQSKCGQPEPLESIIHQALLVRQSDALPIAVKDGRGLWPERLGELISWRP
ncbi:hypothetical protein HGP14_32560 [Rhizobium sp. P32RR-XVIII]|uniref:hypothetical protein n=1 Tax=Rhizobium sp. P32RR-XVIII TaxID=2726738 RepID=UPI001456B6A0|nr:hypothetical protein [Rhizobium sp. P32RR-XVIII]NLS07961.1 hypothetical protein [Rhizobium sp. P32RR-XVIII]